MTKRNNQTHRRYNKSLKGRYRNLRRTAKKHKRVLRISLEQFAWLMTQRCYYCASALRAQGYCLDRKNNAKGYTLENVVPCCWECNRIRGAALTMDETKIVIKALKKYRRSRGRRPQS